VRVGAVALPLVGLALLACSRETPAARAPAGVVTDDLGREVTVSPRPLRIASLSPAATEILFAVGCGAAIVLRDGWSDAPAEANAIPAVTGFTPSAEAILSARPELVLVSYPPAALAAALDTAHVRFAAFSPPDLAGVARSLRAIGALCGETARGEHIAVVFEGRVEEARRRVAQRPRVRVYYEMDAVDPTRPYTVGRGSFGHELIEAAGGDNAFAAGPAAWFQVSTEAVLAADPDVIVIGDADAIEAPQSIATLRARTGWSSLRVIRAGRVVSVPKDLCDRPGPRLAEGVLALARSLHQDAFDGAPPSGEAP